MGPPALGQRLCPCNQLQWSKLSQRERLPRTAVPSLWGEGCGRAGPSAWRGGGPSGPGSCEFREEAAWGDGREQGQGPCTPAGVWAVFRGLCSSPIGSLCTKGGDRGGGQDSPALKMGSFRDTAGRDISPMTCGVCSSSESVYSIYRVYTAHSTCVHLLYYTVYMGFFESSVGKESACNAGDLGSIPESGRSPGEGIGYPLQYSGLENSLD